MNINKSKCDCCGKETEDHGNIDGWIHILDCYGRTEISVSGSDPNEYRKFHELNSEKNNSSCLDFCSPECLLSFLGFTKEEKESENHSISVDFNNLRIQMVKSYNRLILRMRHGSSDINKPSIMVNVEDILPSLEALRDCIATLACSYREGDENFKNIADKLPEILSLEEDE